MKIGDNEYRAERMPPREQFHLMRRLAPLVGTMGPAVVALLDENQRDAARATVVASIGPIADAIAAMPDETVDYILDACLTHVQRQDKASQTWAPIYIRQPKGAIRMFQDLDAMGEMMLVTEAIKVNLSGFFGQLSGGSASSLSAQPLARVA